MTKSVVEIEALRKDIPHADYLRLDAVSSSLLKDMERSPAYARHRHLNPTPSTDAMVFGTAVHLAILQPDLLKERIGFLPADFNGRTKAGKELKAQMQTQYDGVLKHEDGAALSQIVTSVLSNDKIRGLLHAAGGVRETTVTVKDPETDLMCKCRPDLWLTSQKVIIDLKKTVKRSVHAFLRQAHELRYFRQMSFYRAVCRWLCDKGLVRIEAPDMAAFLVITDEAPYENTLVPVPREVLDKEEVIWREYLNRYADYVQAGEFPGWQTVSEADLAGYIKSYYEI